MLGSELLLSALETLPPLYRQMLILVPSSTSSNFQQVPRSTLRPVVTSYFLWKESRVSALAGAEVWSQYCSTSREELRTPKILSICSTDAVWRAAHAQACGSGAFQSHANKTWRASSQIVAFLQVEAGHQSCRRGPDWPSC